MDNSYPFLAGGGEMGELTQGYNWSANALGTPDTWPKSLRTLVNMMLTSRFPMLIFWGRDLITFYNDAFRPSLGNNGKHPSSLGQPGHISWAESWPWIGPMIHNIMNGGDAVWFEDQKLPIYREGTMGFAYWTYSFSPLTDDDGSVNGILVTCTETTQAVLSREKLEQSQQEMLSFFEQAPVAVAVISKENLTFRIANPFYSELVGRSPDQLIGKALLEALPELNGQGFDDLLDNVIDTGKPFSASEQAVTLLINNTLETIYVNFIYQPFYGIDDVITGVIVVATDVTPLVKTRKRIQESEDRYRQLSLELEQKVQLRTEELAHINQELMAANEEYAAINEELQESNNLLHLSNDNLRQFAYVASHDLQEPLRKIQQFGSLLLMQKADLSQECQLYVERMQQSASRMSSLIKDLLNFAILSSQQLRFEPVDLNLIVKRVLSTFELSVKETQATIRVSSLPTVSGDETQLEQVFQNLIGNALKFRKPDRKPEIIVRGSLIRVSALPAHVSPARNADKYVQVEIRDNGIGFEEKHLERIFQVFQRLHGKHEFAGTGIGLAICERVVTYHGGAITAASTVGEGSTFYVFLPV